MWIDVDVVLSRLKLKYPNKSIWNQTKSQLPMKGWEVSKKGPKNKDQISEYTQTKHKTNDQLNIPTNDNNLPQQEELGALFDVAVVVVVSLVKLRRTLD